MTIKDIAKIAGVSIGTVDRVLHNRGRVAESTRRSVLKIVEESKYSTNYFASNLANSKKFYKISVIVPKEDQDSGYWSLVVSSIRSLYEEFKSYNISIDIHFFDRLSSESFKRVYDKQNSSDADALFIAPVISKAAQRCFRDNPCKKVYAFFDSNIPSLGQLFFIGQDSFRGGVLGGKMLHLLVGDSGAVGVTRMLPEGNHINDRVAGFFYYFKDFPDIKVYEFEVDYSDDDRDIESVCENILEPAKNIKGLFVSNANTHNFAKIINREESNLESCSLKSKDRSGGFLKKREIINSAFGIKPSNRISIVGYDLVLENKKCLKSGDIDFLISQNPSVQVIEGLRMLYRRLILKESCPKERVVSLDLVTKENI